MPLQACPWHYFGGLCANPLTRLPGPSILGIGFLLRALIVLILGTPCNDLGSFISVGSSLAGVLVIVAR